MRDGCCRCSTSRRSRARRKSSSAFRTRPSCSTRWWISPGWYPFMDRWSRWILREAWAAASLEHLQGLLGGKIDELRTRRRARRCIQVAREGEVIGGCLSVVVARLARRTSRAFDGAILFLEDTGEKAYRIDRMLVQLRQSGALGRVAGIVFGAIRAIDGNEQETHDRALRRRADRGPRMPGAVRHRGGAWHREFYDSVRRGCANRFRRAPDYFHSSRLLRGSCRCQEDWALGWSEVEQAFNDAVEQGLFRARRWSCGAARTSRSRAHSDSGRSSRADRRPKSKPSTICRRSPRRSRRRSP